MTSTGLVAAGVASALLNTSQEVGGTLGLAVLVTVATAATRHALSSGSSHGLSAAVHGYSRAFLVASGISFAAFLIALAGFRPAPTRPDAELENNR